LSVLVAAAAGAFPQWRRFVGVIGESDVWDGLVLLCRHQHHAEAS
jgi:hypothetical protein